MYKIHIGSVRTPANSLVPGLISREFQPMCGIFRPGQSGIFKISPFKMPRPSTPSFSSLRSNKKLQAQADAKKRRPPSLPHCGSHPPVHTDAGAPWRRQRHPRPAESACSAARMVSLSLVTTSCSPRAISAFPHFVYFRHRNQ